MGGPSPIGPAGLPPSSEGAPQDNVALLRETTTALSGVFKDATYTSTSDPAVLERLSNLIISANDLTKKFTRGG